MASTLDDVLAYAAGESRICPMPTHWNALWQMLPGCPEVAGSVEPWPPLILARWWGSSDLDKAARLAYQIRWADSHGALEPVETFLRALPVAGWHHSDPNKPRF